MMHKVFVYGTLLAGEPNHRVLGDSKLSKKVSLALHCKMVSLGSYPALVQQEGWRAIRGEVYDVTDDTLQSLDYLEGHPTFYERFKVNGVWVYFLNSDIATGRYPVIESGDWIAFNKVATEKRRKYG